MCVSKCKIIVLVYAYSKRCRYINCATERKPNNKNRHIAIAEYQNVFALQLGIKNKLFNVICFSDHTVIEVAYHIIKDRFYVYLHEAEHKCDFYNFNVDVRIKFDGI